MKTIDEIFELSSSAADLPSQKIIDALYEYEEWARKLEKELIELKRSIGHAMKKEYKLSELS
ncbi:MAG: hypothetical protein DRH97_00825 [Chloroflexi bacterium]|nr:MAG: hypothetical protein DRH97_00825 [Chloroflexota bacterium]